jgi:hypothetical protein
MKSMHIDNMLQGRKQEDVLKEKEQKQRADMMLDYKAQ